MAQLIGGPDQTELNPVDHKADQDRSPYLLLTGNEKSGAPAIYRDLGPRPEMQKTAEQIYTSLITGLVAAGGKYAFGAGTELQSSIAFSTDLGTGYWQPSVGKMNLSISGHLTTEVSASQFRLYRSNDVTKYADLRTTSAGHLTIFPSGGNVGINTATPNYKLDIWSATGQIGLSDASGDSTVFWATTSNLLVISDTATQMEYQSLEGSGRIRYLSVYQQRNAGAFTADAQLYAHVVGASSGDPMVQLGIDGVNAFALGIDNSDSDKFKISYSASSTAGLGTNDRFTIYTTGDIAFGTGSFYWDNTNSILSLRRGSNSQGFDFKYRTAGDGLINAGDAANVNSAWLHMIGVNANEYFDLSVYDFGHTISARNAFGVIEFHIWNNGSMANYGSVFSLTATNVLNQSETRNIGDTDGVGFRFDATGPWLTTTQSGGGAATFVDYGFALTRYIRMTSSAWQPITDAAMDVGLAGGTPKRFNNVYAAAQMLPDSGTAGGPSHSFSSETTMGLYRRQAGTMTWSVGSTGQYEWQSDNIYMRSSFVLNWLSGALGTGIDAFIKRRASGALSLGISSTTYFELQASNIYLDSTVALNFLTGAIGSGSVSSGLIYDGSSGVLAQKNSTTAQTYRVYGTTTGPKYISVLHDGTDGKVDVAASSGKLILGGNASDIQWGKALVALGGGAAPTLGTIGGSGPATAAQNSWMQVKDSAGNTFWVPAWK